MNKKEIEQKKVELCELQIEAIKNFKNFFVEKVAKLKKKNGKKPKS
jgi:hypothetical protein